MNRIFQTSIAFVSVLLCACTPKINPIDALPETTWEPVYIKGATNLKTSKEKAYIHFEKNLELTIMGGVYLAKADISLTRKKIKRSECHLKIDLKQTPTTVKDSDKEFLEFQTLFIKDLTSADAIRLNANKLEFLSGKKLLVELKRIPHFTGKKKPTAN